MTLTTEAAAAPNVRYSGCGCERYEQWQNACSMAPVAGLCPTHAAAPKLLEALRAILASEIGGEWDGVGGAEERAIILARAAIRDAEGQQ